MKAFSIDASALKAVSMAAGKGKEYAWRQVLTCVYITQDEIAATDSFIALHYKHEHNEDIPEEGLLFDAQLFKSIKPYKALKAAGRVLFEETEGGLWTINGETIAKPIEGRFPNYKQLFEYKPAPTDRVCLSADLLERISKAYKAFDKNEGYQLRFQDGMNPVLTRGNNKAKELFGLIMPVRIR